MSKDGVAENEEAEKMMSQHRGALSAHQTTPGEVKHEVSQSEQ